MNKKTHIYRHSIDDDFDSRWDTTIGRVVFKNDSPVSMGMDEYSEGDYQNRLIEALVGVQEIIYEETGELPLITIS